MRISIHTPLLLRDGLISATPPNANDAECKFCNDLNEITYAYISIHTYILSVHPSHVSHTRIVVINASYMHVSATSFFTHTSRISLRVYCTHTSSIHTQQLHVSMCTLHPSHKRTPGPYHKYWFETDTHLKKSNNT